jgi:hypothetical protein
MRNTRVGLDLRSQISVLVEIQELEAEARKLQRQLDAIPVRVGALEQRKSAFEELLARSAAELDALRKEYRGMERESQENRQKMARSRERLMAVKTNKEYAAGLKEIEDLEALNSELEDRMIERLEAIDNAEKHVAERQRSAKALTVEVQGELTQLSADTELVKQELARLTAQCQQRWKDVTPEMLAISRATRARQPTGNIVAPVTDALCRGCQRNIPHQLYNELQRWDTVRHCPHCQRIIYCDRSE